MRRDATATTMMTLLLALGVAAAAQAKVVFTGYADFRLTPQSTIRFDIPAPLAVASGVASGRSESRTAALDSVGLFAANSLSERTEFLFDITYRDIGFATRTVRLQYAYMSHAAGRGVEIRAGKITVPFGHMNQNRFYSFQQASVTQPTFIASILGLPISDLGIAVQKTLEAGPVAAYIVAYGVNGYGPVPGSRTSLRSATLPGGLTIANNLGARDANKKPAGGVRLVLSPVAAPGSEIGGSFYAGHWDAAGKRMLQMANAHLLCEAGPVELLAEYLFMQAEDDSGFSASLGARDWRTDGAFATLRGRGIEVLGRKLVPWARAEDYRTKGIGGVGHERLRAYGGGAAWNFDEGITIKLEVNQLIYGLPWPSGGDLVIDAVSYVLGLAVSF